MQRNLQTISHSTKTFLNVDRLELHERLGQILTPPLQKSLFLVSGSDAIEASVDLARKATGGLDMLGLHAGLHGSTSFLTRSLTFAWARRKHALVAPATSSILAPYCYRCPLGLTFPKCEIQCLKTSLTLADANFTAKPAGFIGEPVLSAGGLMVPPPGFYAALQSELKQRDMLMILDESQTGLGKTGKLFGFQHEPGVMPDRRDHRGNRRARRRQRVFRDPLACHRPHPVRRRGREPRHHHRGGHDRPGGAD